MHGELRIIGARREVAGFPIGARGLLRCTAPVTHDSFFRDDFENPRVIVPKAS